MKALALPFCLLLSVVCVHAEEDNSRTILDPEKVTPDYHVQGEYTGMLADGQKYGLQVMSLGDDKYQARVYPGGLPGDGYTDADVIEAKGQKEDDVVVISGHDGGYAVLDNGEAEVFVDEESAGKLKRVNRKSPTLGQKPPAGAVVLFDGSSTDNFVNGQLLLGQLLADVETRQKFGSHKLHLEFRVPYEPYDREQARGNSGVYVQSRYEIQVLDSFARQPRDNYCGGIYSISAPKVNATFPPLTWQTYDIDFTAAEYKEGEKVKNARVTVRHNGILIHDDLELPHGTPGRRAEAEGPDTLYLQGHGNQVLYRNIWVMEK